MMDQPTALRVPDPGVRDLFTESQRWQSWLDVEAALAQAEAELGMIPQEAAEEIAKKAHVELLDRNRIVESLRVTGHGLVPIIWELDRICDGDAGGYVHWGATTQNITQTGQLMQLRRAHHIFLGQLADVIEAMADLAERTADYLLPGRTHGQHALPATFGFKVAGWIDELSRHVERLYAVGPRIFVAMLGGGAGTMASFGDQAFELQRRYAEKLQMRPMPVPARTIADHQAEYITILGMLGATCAKVGFETYTLMKQEFGEVEEPISAGTVGSSTMPQKRNPKLSQDVIAAGAQLRAIVPLALEAMQTEHEADRTTSVMMGRAIVDATGLTGDILSRLHELIAGLQVFPERMRQNLDLSGGMIMAEALMLELGATIGRQRAHDAVYDAAQAVATTDKTFRELLAESEELRDRFTAAEIDELLDPARYTGQCAFMAREQAGLGRSLAAELRALPTAP
ncbi:MAG TPA: adenylosuccinate lyase family protein [Dehalococcoidia bacterium]|nr:adenylosuccinate lyase family protein [Dehalococcoidia bacterium]